MATQDPVIPLSGLARCLIQDQVLGDQETQLAFEASMKQRVPFVQYLVSEGILSSAKIAASAAREFGAPLFDLDAFDTELIPSALVEEKLIRNHNALPLFKRGNRLFIGVSDPTNNRAREEVSFHTGLAAEIVVVEQDKLTKAIDNLLDAQ